MKLFLLFYLILVTSIFGQGNIAWQSWKNIEKSVKEGNMEKFLSLLSGKTKLKFSKITDLKRINLYLEAKGYKFVREFSNKNKDTLYLVLKTHGPFETQIYKKSADKWTWDDSIRDNIRGLDDLQRVLNKKKTKDLRDKLRNAGMQVALKMSSGDSFKLPTYDKLDLTEKDLSFISPENKKPGKILLVSGYEYLGEDNKILGMTNIPVFGYHYVLFDDGHYDQISIAEFQTLAPQLGLIGKGKKLNERKPFIIKE